MKFITKYDFDIDKPDVEEYIENGNYNSHEYHNAKAYDICGNSKIGFVAIRNDAERELEIGDCLIPTVTLDPFRTYLERIRLSDLEDATELYMGRAIIITEFGPEIRFVETNPACLF